MRLYWNNVIVSVFLKTEKFAFIPTNNQYFVWKKGGKKTKSRQIREKKGYDKGKLFSKTLFQSRQGLVEDKKLLHFEQWGNLQQ